MIRVLLDSQVFDFQKFGGVSRYYAELIRNFRTMPEIEVKHLILHSCNEHLLALDSYVHLRMRKFPSEAKFLKGVQFRGKGRIYSLYSKFRGMSHIELVKRTLVEDDYDVFHPSFYCRDYLDFLNPRKALVVTIHDMILELHPELFRKDGLSETKKAFVERADRIIAISENTRNDLMRLWNVPRDRIDVIYHGNMLTPQVLDGNPCPGLPERFVLYVGSRFGYKNFATFMKAMAPLLLKDRKLHVVVAGGYTGSNGFSPQEAQSFVENQIQGQVHQYSITDQSLSYLYSHALCFVFPSCYEGFGMPVLEAFACGCPTVLSKASSLPEIGGDAALYADPNDAEQLRTAILRLLQDESLRQEFIQRGLHRSLQFSWDKTARQTILAYQKALQGKHS